jgi:hypothetical protein
MFGRFKLLLHSKPQISAKIFVKTWFKSIIKKLFLLHSRILSSCPIAEKILELWIFVYTFLPYNSKTNNYTLRNIYLRSDVSLFTKRLQESKALYRSYSRPLHVEICKRQLGLYKITRPIKVNNVTRYMQDIYK